jgi:hypothetical protein
MVVSFHKQVHTRPAHAVDQNKNAIRTRLQSKSASIPPLVAALHAAVKRGHRLVRRPDLRSNTRHHHATTSNAMWRSSREGGERCHDCCLACAITPRVRGDKHTCSC